MLDYSPQKEILLGMIGEYFGKGGSLLYGEIDVCQILNLLNDHFMLHSTNY